MTAPVNMAAGIAAALLLAAVWAGPVDRLVAEPFAAHMLRHMTLVALAAPLLVLAMPRVLARHAPPVPAGAVIEFVVVWGWHLPGLHALARDSHAWMLLEQAMFLGAGVLVWAGALAGLEDKAPTGRGGAALAGAGGLLLTSMHMTLLGALFILARAPLYGSSLEGLQLGGMLMLGIGTPVYLVGGLILSARALGHGAAGSKLASGELASGDLAGSDGRQ